MKRRTVIVNAVLGGALLVVGVTTAVAVTGGGRQPAPTGTTVAVQRGTVTSTVTATGNVEAGSTVSVSSPGSGKVTKIYVKEGQQVDEGDKLFTIDATSEKQDLATAKASLASAEASMTTTTQGRSSQDRAVDNAGVRSAQTALANARTALSHAHQSYRLDTSQQNRQVADAEDNVDAAKQQKASDQADLDQANKDLAEAQAAGDAAKVAKLQSQISELESKLATDQTAIDTARASLTQARQTRDKTLLADQQAIETQQGQVSTAQDGLSSQQAQRASNQQPARRGAVDSAQAQIDSAQASVDKAELAVKNTTVLAPLGGTVADVSAVVGQSSPSSGGPATGTTSGTSAVGGSATSTASSAGSSSGMITIVDDQAKQVTAAVAEADIVRVKPGQSATVTFPASGKTLSGKVTSVAAQSTVSNNVVQFDVDVSLPTADSSIRLGQTGNVSITTGSHSNVLYVPTSAITTTGTVSVVTRRVAGVDSTVQVETGLVGSTGTEIVRGLSQGDVVVLPTGDSTGSFTFPGSGTSASARSGTPSTSPSASGGR